MKIDASQVLGQGGVKIKTGSSTVADVLKEGDAIRDGLETAEEDLSAPQKNLVKDFTDKSLAPYASKLAEYNMPVTEESARMMRELIAQNPGLSRDEAAFLASNKITGDVSLMNAALETIAGGDKTDAMITRILSLINEQGSVDPNAYQTSSPENTAAGFTVNTTNAAPLTELLTNIVKNFAGVFDTPAQGESQTSVTTQTIIAHSDTVIQTNAGIVDDLLTYGNQEARTGDPAVVSGEGQPAQILETGAQPGSQPQVTSESQQTAAVQQTQPQTSEPAQAQIQQAETSQQPGIPEQIQTQTQTQTQQAETPQQPQTLPTMGNVVTQLLSNIPEFSGTPQSALQRFSEMLLRVAGDNPEKVSNTDELITQLEKLFTRIGKNDNDAGTRLRDARQEMYARLAFIEESISRAAQPARAEMLVQTQKLMDHVRLLNSIDQFVYMQMPVQLNEEKKTADLYIFKRKGRKSIDQDNVNILLAIDLEFMGHWEALVNIKNNKEVSIQMEVPGEDEKEHFNSHTVLLHNMLDDAGFKLISTNIKFSKEETTPLTALSTFDRFSGGQQGIIDFKI